MRLTPTSTLIDTGSAIAKIVQNEEIYLIRWMVDTVFAYSIDHNLLQTRAIARETVYIAYRKHNHSRGFPLLKM